MVDESGRAIKFDGLLGDAVLRESPTAVTAYDAFSIQAGPTLANGAFTDVNGNGSLDFNGTEYKQVAGQIIGSVRYDADSATSDVDTSLILLTLDVRSGLGNNPVAVGLNFYNEIEQSASEHTAFFCSTEQTLASLGLSSAFGEKGLVQSISAAKTPLFGTGDKVGPVTLLGLVLTRESGATDGPLRHYAYPLYNNNKGVATTFVP